MYICRFTRLVLVSHGMHGIQKLVGSLNVCVPLFHQLHTYTWITEGTRNATAQRFGTGTPP